MYQVLLTIMLILSVLIIIAVMMQPSKQNSAASAFSGGASELFGKTKARGFEAFMQKATAVMGVAWVGIAIALAFLSSK
ncbi:preprotein translocase subunit SecG [Vagococcus carniphilus]|uniref:Protein-export membrane protein SecG n=1 Tax=Vagococcus carniphilus TaxID=218144 RepID=A0AAW8U7U2_9ENTE|nr:preprotein translocase subunit SecG [Vagococcus carniphilus]MDT2815604.1 preprotein translocase subunit SecG [Vagococcus carniphilus]MDT2830762.1 preprotein translocase subunit SecG [Vagococcus carniphilus]MDT2833065.1 preprotein translocase subunit SecG [Vagococcus carniphilus]MDT2839466.1 preprotein translocase subunit SecG [Vagococcus carniphilus]MDT2848515.1 preprotein translocase subunit SecG [Vagococcus carniphilus]